GDLQDELAAQRVRGLLVADDHLGDARGIPQIDERHASVIATTIDPARESDGPADVLGSQGAGRVSAKHEDFLLIGNGNPAILRGWDAASSPRSRRSIDSRHACSAPPSRSSW